MTVEEGKPIRIERRIHQPLRDLMDRKMKTVGAYEKSANYDEWVIRLYNKIDAKRCRIEWDDEDAHPVKLTETQMAFIMELIDDWGEKRVANHYDSKFVKDMRLRKDDRDRRNP